MDWRWIDITGFDQVIWITCKKLAEQGAFSSGGSTGISIFNTNPAITAAPVAIVRRLFRINYEKTFAKSFQDDSILIARFVLLGRVR